MWKKGILLIQSNNINSKRLLNKSRPHLNDTGVSAQFRNYRTYFE